ncbi:hypothetical protein [Streptomyces sp. SID3343]|uniref:hypothetical protein n=1 Tax=Streptomyces sp. SID3343 TaxID=2690260 RepID=UPI00136F3BDB|nr:hypothetical protein [Streptomyces sp. SID3343]
MKMFFEADPSPRRTFTAYPRRAAGAVVVVRWVWLADGRWRFRDRLELGTRAVVRALACCEQTQVHDAALAVFEAAFALPGLGPKALEAVVSAELGQDHARFALIAIEDKRIAG